MLKDIDIGCFMSVSPSLSQERFELGNIAIEIVVFHFDGEELGPSSFFFAGVSEPADKGKDKIVP